MGSVVQLVPVLSIVGSDLIWTWAGVDPTFWQIELAPTQFGSYVTQFNVAGAGRSRHYFDAGWYRLVGTVGGVPVTPYSNSVPTPV